MTSLAKTTEICPRGYSKAKSGIEDLCYICSYVTRWLLVSQLIVEVSIQSHNSTTITEVRQSTVVWVQSSPDSQLVTLVQYELADANAVVKLDGLGTGQQRHVGWTCGGHDGA